MEPFISCSIENAPKFWTWCQTRGGVARWRSVNLSNPGASWSTPAKAEDGAPTPRPTWEADNLPELVASDPAKIFVFTDKEVRRFPVAIKRAGVFGLRIECTPAATERIRRAVDAAGKDAYYQFDYDTQEAVILVPVKKQTLLEWAQEKGVA